MSPKALCAACGRYAAPPDSIANVSTKQCVSPSFSLSGLLFVPHSKSIISVIFDGSSRNASTTPATSSLLKSSLFGSADGVSFACGVDVTGISSVEVTLFDAADGPRSQAEQKVFDLAATSANIEQHFDRLHLRDLSGCNEHRNGNSLSVDHHHDFTTLVSPGLAIVGVPFLQAKMFHRL